MNKVITYFLIITLSLLLIVELANLIGFGSQEFYLNHPDYPEGEQFKKDLESGRFKLIMWTLLTLSLLISAAISKLKKRNDWINRIALIFFGLTNYLPFLSFTNGKITNGFIQAGVTVTLTLLMYFKMKNETVNE